MPTAGVEGPAPASLPLRERLIAVFRFNRWVPKRFSKRSCERKRSSSGTKTDATGAQRKARGSNEQSGKKQVSRKKVKDAAHPPHHDEQQMLQQLEHHITSISNNPPVVARAKIANYEPPKSYTSRRIGSISPSSRNYSGPISGQPSRKYSLTAGSTSPSSRNYSGPIIATQPSRNYSLAGSRRNSGTQSVPVSGELSKSGTGGPTIVRSSSKSLTKLRDQYVKAMMKLGDMADSVAIGNSVNFESQVFESEVIRKRSTTENEMMDYYLNSSIRPDEWKDAHMGSRVIRDGAITV